MMFLAFDKNQSPVYGLPTHTAIKNVSEIQDFVEENNCDCIIKNLSGIWHCGETTNELIVTKSDAKKLVGSKTKSTVKQETI